MDWFLYDRDLHHERVKCLVLLTVPLSEIKSCGVFILYLDKYDEAKNP